jgi:hypothetical protein
MTFIKKINVLQALSLKMLASFSLIAALFATPISSSLQSIFLVMSLGSVLLCMTNTSELRRVMTRPWCLSGVGLFALSVLGCFWTSASSHDALVIVGKYSKLLYLPLLVLGFRDEKIRHDAIHAFLAAMFLTCCLSFLKWFGVLHYHGDDPSFVFRNHIMTGYMMAFAAYLCLWYCVKTQDKKRIVYGALALLFSYQVLFIGMGRTSYLIYVALIMLLAWHVLSWRKALIGMVMLGVIFGAVFHESDIMRQRAHEAVSDWKSYHQQTAKDTPVGFRLQFHAYAHTLFNRHPWIGNGTSGFSDAFKKEQPVPGWGETLFEPHSQYWLIAADWGYLGMIVFVSFFGSLFLAAQKLKETKPIAIGLLVSFLLGSFLDSLLLYSGTGYFFLLFIALCLAEQISNETPANNLYNQLAEKDAPVLAR